MSTDHQKGMKYQSGRSTHHSFPFTQDVFTSPLDEELKLTLKLKENYLRTSSMLKRRSVAAKSAGMSHPRSGTTLSRTHTLTSTKSCVLPLPLSKEIPEKLSNSVISRSYPRLRQTQALRPHSGRLFLSLDQVQAWVIYLYPHRVTELRTYEEYILGQFTAAPERLIITLTRHPQPRRSGLQ